MQLIDYIEQNTATFDERPFSEVDALALTQACMVDARWLVPDVPSESDALSRSHTLLGRLLAHAAPRSTPVRLADLVRAEHFEHMFLGLVPGDIKRCLYALAASPRFRDLTLSCHRMVVDDLVPTQFGALAFSWRDAFTFVGFQGTGAPFPGWRENVDMAWRGTMPAHEQARIYLEEMSEHVPGVLHAGGHSKGGNLALYATLMSSPKVMERIAAVWAFDAPGFARGLFSPADYQALGDRVHRVVPERSVVGMLLDASEAKVVRSDAAPLMQHSVFTWQIEAGQLVLGTLDEGSRAVHEVLNAWLARTDRERVQQVADALFDAVESSGCSDARDLMMGGTPALQRLLDAVWHLPREQRNLLSDVAAELGAVAWERMGRDVTSALAELWSKGAAG